ncbi:MAG: SDR family NAD(P)-dependent oxidoreductase [Myxococcales bacterium]|nr:SDR family NAD(P)-dependent oxidoreductase [Myxococcales bacterium]MCB9532137.1 SDR family NAD(P)-dependent oxidoreductase [Myxococcales bacterium]
MAKRRVEFNGALAVVTGAASGIGRATALALARRGCRIAISDVDMSGLDETAARASALGVAVDACRLDVASRDAIYEYAAALEERCGPPNLVVNNAGVACVGRIRELSDADLEWVMAIDFWGVVHGTRAFLPALERASWGHVVNLSSVFGIVAVPTQGAYNAAKFAVRGFTECLRQELELDGSTVSATCVHPGGIDTDIARNARFAGGTDLVGERERAVANFARAARTTPDAAAAAILRAVERDAPRVLIGADAHAIDLGQRSLPTAYRFVSKALASAGGRLRR